MNIINLLTKEQSKLLKKVSLKKEHILFYENDLCEYVGIIIKGDIVISSYSISGKEIIYNSLTTNDMFGNNLIFSQKPYYKGNVIAKSDAELALINKKDLLYILENNESFLENYLMMQADFSKKLNAKIKILSFDSALERLYCYFHDQPKIYFSSTTSLAHELFLSRETLSRLLSDLEKQKKIKRGKNYIELIN